jgi:L-asparagine transporter-like permease
MYMGASFLLVTLAPWTSAGLGESPFVTVLGKAGVPAAAAVTNAIVLTAALSSAVANLYVSSRMLFSLAESGYAPRGLGRVDRRGVPVTAVLMGVPLLVLATLANLVSPDRTYGYLLGVATFAGFFVWIAIFVTHLQFRRAWARRAEPLPYRMRGHPWASISGLVLMVGILLSTWFVDAMWIAIPSGLAWLALMTVAFVARPGKA